VTVSPGYFEATGVRLAKGRFFQDGDAGGKRPVIIVDEKLARRFWPDQDPIGRRLFMPTDINNLLAVNEKTVFLDVVGVIKDVKLRDIAEGEKGVGAYYFPMSQNTSSFLTFAVKTQGAPEVVAGGLRTTMAALDPELPLFDVRTLAQRTETALVARRSSAMLSLTFGLVALLLSAVGVYGVLAYLVNQRTREIGIRMALGATADAVVRLVMRQSARLAGIGGLIGVAVAFAVMKGLSSLVVLHEVSFLNLVPFAAGVSVVAAAAAIAAFFPARRAAHVDPAETLRAEA
jgi:ABC-type antimicrobial peptide transport system permease subunit